MQFIFVSNTTKTHSYRIAPLTVKLYSPVLTGTFRTRLTVSCSAPQRVCDIDEVDLSHASVSVCYAWLGALLECPREGDGASPVQISSTQQQVPITYNNHTAQYLTKEIIT